MTSTETAPAPQVASEADFDTEETNKAVDATNATEVKDQIEDGGKASDGNQIDDGAKATDANQLDDVPRPLMPTSLTMVPSPLMSTRPTPKTLSMQRPLKPRMSSTKRALRIRKRAQRQTIRTGETGRSHGIRRRRPSPSRTTPRKN